MAEKKILIAGATGYLGRHLVQEAKNQGYWTRALTRDAGKLASIEEYIDDMFVGLKIYKDINRDTGNGKIFFHKNDDVLMSIWKRGNSYDLFISSKLFSSSKLRYVNFGDGNWENIQTNYPESPIINNVYLICDTTPFRTGKRGFIISQQGLFWNNHKIARTNRNYLDWREFSTFF